MKICYIMSGVPGSGKSTVVNKLVEFFSTNYSDYTIAVFSLDQCRLNFCPWAPEDPKERYSMAFEYCKLNQAAFDLYVAETWKTALQADILVVDNTNLTRKARARWCADAKAKKFQLIGVEVLAPLSVVIERQTSRPDKAVPVDVITSMYNMQQSFIVGNTSAHEVQSLVVIDGTSNFQVETAVIY